MLVLDTDHLDHLQRRRSPEGHRLSERLRAGAEPVATTIVSVEEQMRGWLAAIRRRNEPQRQIEPYRELGRLFTFFSGWEILYWDDRAVFAYLGLRKQRVRVATMDLKIASITLANDAILLSRNLRDFEKVPGLRVEDWLSE